MVAGEIFQASKSASVAADRMWLGILTSFLHSIVIPSFIFIFLFRVLCFIFVFSAYQRGQFLLFVMLMFV